MIQPLRGNARRFTVLTLFVLLAGCSAFTGDEDTEVRDSAALADGYSLLYSTMSGMRYSDELLLVKRERERFQGVIEQVSDYASSLRSELDGLAEAYPAVRLYKDALPEMERRKRDAVNADRVKSLAPLVGKEGADFERTLLLSSSGVLNQMRYLCQVMAQMETDANLKKILLETEQKFSDLYDTVVQLLNEEYFVHDTFRKEG